MAARENPNVIRQALTSAGDYVTTFRADRPDPNGDQGVYAALAAAALQRPSAEYKVERLTRAERELAQSVTPRLTSGQVKGLVELFIRTRGIKRTIDVVVCPHQERLHKVPEIQAYFLRRSRPARPLIVVFNQWSYASPTWRWHVAIFTGSMFGIAIGPGEKLRGVDIPRLYKFWGESFTMEVDRLTRPLVHTMTREEEQVQAVRGFPLTVLVSDLKLYAHWLAAEEGRFLIDAGTVLHQLAGQIPSLDETVADELSFEKAEMLIATAANRVDELFDDTATLRKANEAVSAELQSLAKQNQVLLAKIRAMEGMRTQIEALQASEARLQDLVRLLEAENARLWVEQLGTIQGRRGSVAGGTPVTPERKQLEGSAFSPFRGFDDVDIGNADTLLDLSGPSPSRPTTHPARTAYADAHTRDAARFV